jgi:hypothetical protein
MVAKEMNEQGSTSVHGTYLRPLRRTMRGEDKAVVAHALRADQEAGRRAPGDARRGLTTQVLSWAFMFRGLT